MKKVQFTLILAIVGLLSLHSQFNQKPERAHYEKGSYHGGMKEKLNLSESQEKEILEIRQSAKKEMLQIRSEINVKQAELKMLQLDDNTTLADLEKKVDEISTLKGKAHKQKVKGRYEVRKLLNEDQRLVFDEFASKRKKQMHQSPRGHQGRR